MKRNWTVWLCAFALAASSSTPALGSIIGGTTSHLVARAGDNESDFMIPTTGEASEDYFYQFLTVYSILSQADAITGGGLRPTATAQAEHTIMVEPGAAISGGDAQALAELDYYVRVVQNAPTPIGYQPPLFISIDVQGEATMAGIFNVGVGTANGAGGDAFALVDVSYGGTFAAGGSAEAFAQVGRGVQLSSQFNHRFQTTITPTASGYADFAATVLARAVAGAPYRGGTTFASASADPFFTFDQDAFDAFALQQGFATFRLTDYFSFEYSDGILPVQSVPEPSASLLMSFGLLVLFGACFRKYRSRGHHFAHLTQ